ncbi:hypothetical protein SB717_21780 [Priestia sp. SIMBA_032]|uniref:hypothetical protein n=1 Tax=Priestia sp. SIMBA_032 TaxID=3085775 RepID=UPI00397DFD07
MKELNHYIKNTEELKGTKDTPNTEVLKSISDSLKVEVFKGTKDAPKIEILKGIKDALKIEVLKGITDLPKIEVLKGITDLPKIEVLKGVTDLPKIEVLKGVTDLPKIEVLKGVTDLPKIEVLKGVTDLPRIKVPEVVKNGLKLNIPKIKSGEVDYESFYRGSENIGKWGWTVPFSFGLVHIKYFENDSLTKRDVDKFFYNYYSSDNDEFDKMTNSILKNKDIYQWHEAIKQCVYAHKHNRYILSISTLIPVLEGILSTFESNKSNIRMMKVCKDMLNTTDDESLIDKIMWTSCYHFISALYKKSDFSKTEPEIINRHWILHGRTAFNSSEIDSLRIFNAIETVSGIMKFHNREKNKNKQDK